MGVSYLEGHLNKCENEVERSKKFGLGVSLLGDGNKLIGSLNRVWRIQDKYSEVTEEKSM